MIPPVRNCGKLDMSGIPSVSTITPLLQTGSKSDHAGSPVPTISYGDVVIPLVYRSGALLCDVWVDLKSSSVLPHDDSPKICTPPLRRLTSILSSAATPEDSRTGQVSTVSNVKGYESREEAVHTGSVVSRA